MSRRTNLVLLAALLVFVALLVFNRSANHDESVAGAVFVAELGKNAETIDQITITGPGSRPVATLRRDENGWGVSERQGYPADIVKLSALLRALAQAKIVEQKTTNSDYHNRLGVEDLDNEDAAGTGVGISGSGLDLHIILGNAVGNHRYARHAGDPQAWLIDINPDVPAQTSDWLADDILDIDSSEVQSVKITHPNGETIEISKPEPDTRDYEFAELPEGRELQYDSIANGIGNALQDLTLDDVALASNSEEPAILTELTTFDGLHVFVASVERDGEIWSSFRLEKEPDTAIISPEDDGNEGDDLADTEEADLPQLDVDAMNEMLGGWEYKLPSFKAEALIRSWDDLLKEEENDA